MQRLAILLIGFLFLFTVSNTLKETLDLIPVERDERLGIFFVQMRG